MTQSVLSFLRFETLNGYKKVSISLMLPIAPWSARIGLQHGGGV
jgi:hypothetical protein